MRESKNTSDNSTRTCMAANNLPVGTEEGSKTISKMSQNGVARVEGTELEIGEQPIQKDMRDRRPVKGRGNEEITTIVVPKVIERRTWRGMT
jgi:hypothetical protein